MPKPSPAATRAPQPDYLEELFQGRRIQVYGMSAQLPELPVLGGELPGSSLLPKMSILSENVLIDGAPLPVMAHHGRYLSVLNMHAFQPSLTHAAREAVRRLNGARLLTGANRLSRTARRATPTPPPAGWRPPTRRNVAALSAAQRADLVRALLTLKDDGTYDAIVDLHHRAFYETPWGAHMTYGFLPWHRAFLELLEYQIQRVVPAAALPYWDWSTQRSAGEPPFTSDLLGGDGYYGSDAGRSGRPARGEVTEGPFAYRNGQWPLNVRVDSREFLHRDLGGDSGAPTPSGPSHVRTVLSRTVYDRSPYDTTVSSFRNDVEGWWDGGDRPAMHNRAHLWVGGVMASSVSPNDPAFFLMHAYVDKLWEDWRRQHPSVPHLAPARALDEPLEPFRSELGWPITPRELLSRVDYA